MNDLENIFRPLDNSPPLPMLNERLNVLHETGSILLQVCYLIFTHLILIFI